MVRARSIATADADLLASAVALRWSRPDLTAAVAEHIAGTWVADDRTWVAATGWLVHGRAAVGDGREHASGALTELLSRDPALLDDPAADRLRIEVATLAAAQREPAVARQLVEPLGGDRPAEVRADALAVLARCAFEDRPAVVGEAIRRAADAWAAVRGAQAEVAVAALTHLSAAAARRAGHPEAAADHAAEGLARLDDLRPGTSAPHLAAALAAEWITALVEAGRAEEACAACTATAKHLVSLARPTRQIALLRLTVARALAESSSPGAVEALEQAASDASACDVPDLEGLCLSTLGALREQGGRIDAALESMRRGVAAQRRDRARSERFRATLRALPLMPSGTPAPMIVAGRPNSAVSSQGVRGRQLRTEVRPDEPHPFAANPWTTGRWTTGTTRSATEVGRTAAIGSAADLPHGAGGVGRDGAAVDVLAVAGAAVDLPQMDGGGRGPAAGVETDPGSAADRPHTAVGVETGSASAADLPGSDGGAVRGTAVGVETSPGAAAHLPRFDGVRAGHPAPRVRSDFAGAGGLDAGETLVDPLFGALGGPKPAGEPATSPTVRAQEPAPAHVAGAHDNESWLATALAELDSAWGRSLAELGHSVDPRDDAPERLGVASAPSPPDDTASAAGIFPGDDASDDAFDEEAASPWANWADEQPEISRGGGPTGSGRGGGPTGSGRGGGPTGSGKGRDDNTPAADPLGTPGRSDRAGSAAVGCVVVVDVVCAGAAVPEGATLLAGLVERLTERIPAGARMRLDEGDSTLSVVMPGQEQPVAADWMHRTLPGVFHDASASDVGELLPVGSALRATVHDTDGPVGAQLLQRLDGAGAGPATAPLVPVRWGVPIAPGSGGRRRRPDDAGGVLAGAVDTAGRPGRHREGPDDGPPAFGRPMVSRRPRPWPGASVGTLGSATTAPSNDLGTASPLPAAIDGLPAAIDGRDGVRGGSPTSGKRRRGRDTADAVRRAAAGDGHRPAAGDASDVGAASAEVPDAETMGASAAAEVASDAGALELDLRSEVASAGPNAADAGEGFGGAAVGAAENDAVREGGGAEADGEPDGSGGDPRSPAVPAGGQAAPADPEPAPAPVASQREISVEGLGLADLLAGALAAYRAI